MRNKKNQLLARLDRIVEISYEILKGNIISGTITPQKVKNEASLQLLFGVILKQVGSLLEYDAKDSFEITLEEVQNVSTVKSPKGARCDIMLYLANGATKVSTAIELKLFKAHGKAANSTPNRRSVYLDVQNLEKYKCNHAYELVYTTNANYPNPNSWSAIRLGDGETMRTINDGTHNVDLRGEYLLSWDCYNKDGEACKESYKKPCKEKCKDHDKHGHFFLLIPVK